MLGQLANVYEAVFAWQNLDERAEVHKSHDLAGVDVAHLHLAGEVFDHLHCLHRGGLVDRANNDRAVVGHVYGGAGGLDYAANGLAAGADDGSDLVHWYADLEHARRVGAKLGAAFGQRLGDAFQDVEPRLSRLLQRVPAHVQADALQLDVQLYGGYAFGRARHLEVHVAYVVFLALDVSKRDVASVVAGDQAHGYAGDRGLDGYAGVHERERAGADAAHGGAAVGAEHLGDDSYGVREVVAGGEDGRERAFGQRAVANLAPAGGTDAPRLAHGVGREVIV